MTEYEINLWNIFKIIYKKKFVIIGIMIISVIISYVFSTFYLEKKYRTEAWLEVNDNFITKNNLTQSYINQFLLHPDVIKRLKINDSKAIGLKNSISLRMQDHVSHLSYIHGANPKVAEFFKDWLRKTKTKIVLYESQEVIANIEEYIHNINLKINREHDNLKAINQLLSKKNQYLVSEVWPKDSTIEQILSYKEINDNYMRLINKKDTNELQINNLKYKQKELKDFLSQYKVFLKKLEKDFNADESNYILEEMTDKIRKDYNSIFETKKDIIPFKVILVRHNPSPISPNRKFNIVFGALVGVFLSVIIVLFLDFIEDNKSRKKTQATT